MFLASTLMSLKIRLDNLLRDERYNSSFSMYKLPDILPSSPDQLTNISIDSSNVLAVLKDLNPTRAAGCDGY